MKAKKTISSTADNASYIKGERIYLRPVTQSDVTARYVDWLNDPEVNRFLESRFTEQTLETIADYVKKMENKKEEPFFAICLQKNEQHIGNIKLGPINWHHRSADISLLIGEKNVWGQGYAREAISIVTDLAFNKIGLYKLKAGLYAPNLAGIKAFEHCGYIQEGRLRKQVLYEEKYIDLVLLGLPVSEYRK